MRKIFIRIVVFLILILEATPNFAYAHGIELGARYIGLSAFVVGLASGIICAIRKCKIESALLIAFSFYLIILLVSAFFLPGEFNWSDIWLIFVSTILFGLIFGFFPLLIGLLAMHYGLNYYFKVINRRP